MGLRLYIIFAIAIGVVAAGYSDNDVNDKPRYYPDSRDYDDDELDEELNYIGGKVQTIEQKLEREIKEHPPNRRRRAKYRNLFKHIMNILEKGVKMVPMISNLLDQISETGSDDDDVVGGDESAKSAKLAKSAKSAEYYSTTINVDDDVDDNDDDDGGDDNDNAVVADDNDNAVVADESAKSVKSAIPVEPAKTKPAESFEYY